ncbi:MAG: DUF2130 domain-containing protein [Pseudomonadota bacterium]|nr:DUF2130 domain-containing protein [Pseudomonadota bacterium]
MLLQSAPTPSFLKPQSPHLHIDGETCPWCEQEIPPERLEEIRGKIAARERERMQTITAKLEQQYAIDKEQADAKAKADLELERRQSAAREVAAEQKGVALQLQLDELRKAKQAEAAKMREESAAEAIRIRQEATESAEVLARDKIADAQATIAEAEGKLSKLSEQHEITLNERLGSQREILEKAKDDAINAEKAKTFEETQGLSNKVNELQRALEKKTNEELGEGAEIDLFEALKKEFPNDRIERVAKGAPGADILHGVMHNGRECGTIIYDSKNHKMFRNEHVTKLLEDQLAAKAEHAILSTHRFPAGTRQLHMQDGVLLANPARVVSVVTLIRRHLLQAHTLRLSSAERETKTAALYAFITSERCTQLFSLVDAHADELLEQQVKERKWHDAAWKKEGELIRSIQKVQAELSNEISCIIGTAADDEVALEDF